MSGSKKPLLDVIVEEFGSMVLLSYQHGDSRSDEFCAAAYTLFGVLHRSAVPMEARGSVVERLFQLQGQIQNPPYEKSADIRSWVRMLLDELTT